MKTNFYFQKGKKEKASELFIDVMLSSTQIQEQHFSGKQINQSSLKSGKTTENQTLYQMDNTQRNSWKSHAFSYVLNGWLKTRTKQYANIFFASIHVHNRLTAQPLHNGKQKVICVTDPTKIEKLLWNGKLKTFGEKTLQNIAVQ